MIKVLSFLSNENCFVGHSRGSCGPHVIRVPRFEHHWFKLTLTLETTIGYICNTHPLDPLSRSLRWSWNEPFVTIRPDTASWCARNSCEKRYSNWFYLRSLITKGQIQLCIRLKAEVGYVPWGSFVDLHWSISLAYTSNILFTWKLWNWGSLSRLSHLAARLVATVFWLQVTDQQAFVIERSLCAHRFGNSN